MTTEEDAPANLIDLMDRLIEPSVPTEISLVPQTAGWWVLGALLACGLAYTAWRWWHHWQSNAYRRAALGDLARAGEDPAYIATVLRRTALAAFPRSEVAGLAGAQWVAFLQATGEFDPDAAPALLRGPYALGVDSAPLHAAAESWVRSHRRPA
ncbi:DUF4381 domain-containing protein [Meridianimarinicoccus aquatilis]|nr:DUF4381 domain-containing protein [Fluviibacterium aquatile]